jgi:hypothetical protein
LIEDLAMVKNLLFDAMLGRGMIRAANQMQRGVERSVQRFLQNKTASRGVGQAPPAPNIYRDQALFRGTLPELNALFDRFAYKKLTQWKRTNANAFDSTVTLQYQASRHFRVTLEPVTGWARGQESLQLNTSPRYDQCIERISYEYLCDFEFVGQANQTVVRYVATETIDSDGGSSRDLATHYRAPPLPGNFGDIGEVFLAGLRGRGLV